MVGLIERYPFVELLRTRPVCIHVYAQYTILVEDREPVCQNLRTCAVPAAVHYPVSLHRQPAYIAYGSGAKFSASDLVAGKVVSLPIHTDLDQKIQECIIGAVADFRGRA